MVNTENALKWDEALESGDYPQDPNGGYMKTVNGYCCLGFLQEEAGVTSCQVPNDRVYKFDGLESLPRASFLRDFLGLTEDQIHWYGHRPPKVESDWSRQASVALREGTNVASLNDAGVSFKDIAVHIREAWGL